MEGAFAHNTYTFHDLDAINLSSSLFIFLLLHWDTRSDDSLSISVFASFPSNYATVIPIATTTTAMTCIIGVTNVLAPE